MALIPESELLDMEKNAQPGSARHYDFGPAVLALVAEVRALRAVCHAAAAAADEQTGHVNTGAAQYAAAMARMALKSAK